MNLKTQKTLAFVPCAVYPDVAVDYNWEGAVINGAN